jgi:hypothetical protein
MSYGYVPQYTAQPQYAAYPAPMGYGQAPRQSAPPSVHIVAIFHYLGGLLTLLAAAAFGVAALTQGARIPTGQDLIRPEDARIVAAVLAGGLALVALIVLIFARKLQRGRQWARVLTLILCTLSIGTSVLAFVAQQDPTVFAGAVFPALYILLLNTRAARSWFRAHTW